MNQLTYAQSDIELIISVAKAMQNPFSVKKIVLDLSNVNPTPFVDDGDRLYNLILGGGFSGLLSLFVEIDRMFPDNGWDLVVHEYILNIVKAIDEVGIGSLTLYGGLTGICYYIRLASRNETRYKKVLDKLDDFLIKEIEISHISPLKKQLNQSVPCSPHLYEVIQGISGVAIYFLINQKKSSFKAPLHKMISLMIDLTQPITVNGKTVPGWYVSPESFFLDEERIRCPNGNFNLGLSHGITGVLALLSIAMIHGVVLKGQREAIETIAQWIQTKQKTGDDRYFWDSSISFEEETMGFIFQSRKSRDAWCYGTPGVARSLYLAGMALKNESLKTFAFEAFFSIFKSTRKEWNLPDSTMCHGIAGLLIITKLMARDTGSTILEKEVERLREILLAHYDASFPFGFRHAEVQKNKKDEYIWLDQTDLLEGVSGILLALASLHTENYKWHLPFLIDF